jgi:GST-like protein
MDEEFIVVGEADSGSVAVEAALTLLCAPYRVVETSTADPKGAPGTPIGQVPALRLPSGEVMTESAAILIWLADANPDFRLSPPVDSPIRPAFLRWMLFVSASIYAHYWTRDFPARVADDEVARRQVRSRLNARIAQGWSVMEAGITPGAYLLGDDLTVLDLYVTVVSRWTPRKALHETIAPRIGEIARRVEADPRLARLWAERFPIRKEDSL